MKKITLPRTINLGVPFRVSRKKAVVGRDLHVRGYYDHEKRAVVIDKDCTALGEVEIIIHEFMHAAECGMIDAGRMKRHVNHEFIHAASYGAAMALAKLGALKGIGPREIDAYMRDVSKRRAEAMSEESAG